MPPPASAEVARVERTGPPGAPPRLLLEIPHGATARDDFDAVAGRLAGPLPGRLEAFFHVNTDEGAPELAAALAERLAPDFGVLLLRSRLPRTFVDCNRVVEGEVESGMSAGLPPYLRDPRDRQLLLELHARYQRLAESCYAEVCGEGGTALALHTYAPRSIELAVDDDVVEALRRAYEEEPLDRWPLRPEVDLITRPVGGEPLAPAGLVGAARAELERAGFEVAENATYSLHPATAGHGHSRRWPGRVLCLEVRRDLLGDPWRPFEPSPIGPERVARVAEPLAVALARHLAESAA